jgi:hypothetical protein
MRVIRAGTKVISSVSTFSLFCSIVGLEATCSAWSYARLRAALCENKSAQSSLHFMFLASNLQLPQSIYTHAHTLVLDWMIDYRAGPIAWKGRALLNCFTGRGEFVPLQTVIVTNSTYILILVLYY